MCFGCLVATNSTWVSRLTVSAASWTRPGGDLNRSQITFLANIGKRSLKFGGSHMTRKTFSSDYRRLTKQSEVSLWKRLPTKYLFTTLVFSLSAMSEPATGTIPALTLETNGTTDKPSRRPPPRLSFASVDHNNIGTLRKLNSVIFPIVYTERFYAETLVTENADYCKLGL